MQNKLQKAINLAKKTGDRLIVFEHINSDNPFVVMTMEEYEKVALNNNEVKGLTEDELLDKINRDIAVWKNEKSYQEDDEEQESFNTSEIKSEPSRIELDEIKKGNPWGIPVDRKKGAEEIIEEDHQYLEEINQ